MKLVRIEGTVGQLQANHFIGNNTRLEKCMQRFMVKDDTGTIQAVYTTICPNDSLLRNGDASQWKRVSRASSKCVH